MVSLGRARSRRRGLLVGAAIGSSRAKKTAAQQAQVTTQPAPAATPQDQLVEQLKQLSQLKDQGILTQQEFDAKKKKLLGI